jgi:hypothetical protein
MGCWGVWLDVVFFFRVENKNCDGWDGGVSELLLIL